MGTSICSGTESLSASALVSAAAATRSMRTVAGLTLVASSSRVKAMTMCAGAPLSTFASPGTTVLTRKPLPAGAAASVAAIRAGEAAGCAPSVIHWRMNAIVVCGSGASPSGMRPPTAA